MFDTIHTDHPITNLKTKCIIDNPWFGLNSVELDGDDCRKYRNRPLPANMANYTYIYVLDMVLLNMQQVLRKFFVQELMGQLHQAKQFSQKF